jgi:hypothetical protein
MPPKPQLPPNFEDTVKDTGTLTNALIDRIAGVVGAAGALWMKDGFTRNDIAAVSENIGKNLKAQALDAWDVADADVNPGSAGK